jgi:hypothetical protein
MEESKYFPGQMLNTVDTRELAAASKHVYFEWSGYQYRVSSRSNGYIDVLLVEAKSGSTWVRTGSLNVLSAARQALEAVQS